MCCHPAIRTDALAIVRSRLSSLSIHNAIRAIEYLTGLHYPDENIDIILNRSSRKGALSEREIESSLRRLVAVKFPNNYDVIINSINAGTPIDLSRRSDLAAPLDAWAKLLIGESAAEKTSTSKGAHGLFSIFGSQG